MTCKILLTGASGYLGQHLLWHWMTHGISDDQQNYTVVAVYYQNPGFAQAIQNAKSKIQVIPVSCDLSQSKAVDALVQEPFDICIHAAAMASPRVCEDNPSKARQINVPDYFFQKLDCKKRIVALSTDQVYNGKKDYGWYQEDEDMPNPLNVYAKTKLEMEVALQTHANKVPVVILRSSIILGPKAPFTQAHDTFLHFCESREGQETTLFTNEYRTVVSVTHACRILDYFVTTKTKSGGVYHLGGPVRVNRLDMAQAVFAYKAYDPKVLIATEQTSPTTPLDISMDSSRLERLTGIKHEPQTLAGMVELTFQEENLE